MSYAEMQAEKGLLSYTITLPRIRLRRNVLSSRFLTSMACFSFLLVYMIAPARHLTTPFFATYFFHYPFTTFDASEIASLTTEFYELLSKMGQFPPESIKYPPHTHPPVNVKFAKTLGMAPQVIDLIQRLPYVEGNGREWLFDGEFADFREDSDLEESRDPFNVKPDGWSYYSERGPYMRPWQVALNAAGDHGAVFLLDTWTNRIVLTNLLCGCSKDPELEHSYRMETWSKNVNAWEHLPSRRAPDVLQDFIDKFKRLEWLPAEYSPYSTPSTSVARELYRANGWPDNFNLTAFEAAKTQSANYTRQTWTFEEPVHHVRWLDEHIQELEHSIIQLKIKKLDLGVADENLQPLGLESGEAQVQMIEVNDAFKNEIANPKRKRESEIVEADQEIMRYEAKLMTAKEELVAAEKRMHEAALDRNSLPLRPTQVNQQAMLAYSDFKKSHDV